MKNREISGVYTKENFVFDNPGDRVIIGTVKTDDGELITIKGSSAIGSLVFGMTYRFWGHEVSHPKYGDQFHFNSFIAETQQTEQGITAYLRQIRGIGYSTAEAIYNEFGQDSVKTLRENPEAVFNAIPRLSLETCENASEFLKQNQVTERVKIDLIGLFEGRGFPKKSIDIAISRYGVAAAETIKENPFLLLQFPGIGFMKADKMYLDLGYDRNSIVRQAYCIWYGLSSDKEGHTWQPVENARKYLMNGIASSEVKYGEALKYAMTELNIVSGKRDCSHCFGKKKIAVNGELENCPQCNGTGGKGWIADSSRAGSEYSCAQYIVSAIKEAEDYDILWPSPDDLSATLSDHQKNQYKLATSGIISLMTGYPGTGKTFMASLIIKWIIQKYGSGRVALCAPTGKAAQRLNETLEANGVRGVNAVTIHKLLVVKMNNEDSSVESEFGWSFEYNYDNKLPHQFIFVDESSMNATSLMASLLSARAAGSHIMFIGDQNQLAPVGHGFPLRDMIAAKIPCGELTEIRRNSGMIVESCKTIRESGTFISSTKADPSKPQENLIHVNSFAPEDQISKISSIISTLKNKPWGYDPVSDIQVLVPVNESSKLSRVNLNKILQDLVNPKSKANSCDGNPFRIGDKIINSKNGFFICDDEYNPEANENGQVFVANGEMAIVETVSATLTTARLTTRDSVVLKIPSGRKRKDEAAGSETETEGAIASWSLGYAITTHKSQGSEWPIAIVVIDGSGAAKMVCTREWVYTAFSRGKEYVAAVGPGQLVLEFCRKSQVWKRKTFLVELIRQISLNWDELKPDRITIPASSLCE